MPTKRYKRDFLSQYISLFSKTVDNEFSLDKYLSGELLLVGDTVSVTRRMQRRAHGEIVELEYAWKSFRLAAAQVAIGGKIYRVGPARLTHIKRRESWRDHWKAVLGDADHYLETLRGDPAEQVANGHNQDFEHGVYQLAAADPWGLADRFFERTIIKADLTVQSARHVPTDVHRATRALRSKVCASAFLRSPVDADTLLDVSRRLEAYCATVGGGHWDAFHQDLYLGAVRAAILADDLERAHELMKSTRSFRWHKDQRDLLKKLTRKSVRPSKDPDLVSRCHAFLEFVRQPHRSQCVSFIGSWTEIEWAIIVEKLLRDGERPDWPGVITHLYR